MGKIKISHLSTADSPQHSVEWESSSTETGIKKAAKAFATVALCVSNAFAADLKGISPGMSLGDVNLPGISCIPWTLPGKHATERLCSAGTMYGNVYGDLNLYIAKERVGRIFVTGENNRWPEVREGLIAKYGKPTTVDRHTVTTLGGAVLSSETLTWRFPGQKVEASQHVNATHFGVGLSSDEFEAEERRAAGPPGAGM